MSRKTRLWIRFGKACRSYTSKYGYAAGFALVASWNRWADKQNQTAFLTP